MGERTIPIKYLDKESKNEAREMENLDGLIFNSPKATEEEKDNPKKMD
jgi:hypothetical protein